MLLIESALVLAVLILAFVRPHTGSRWFEALECRFTVIARRRGFAVVAVVLAGLVIRAALLPILPIPDPFFHDDFCNLLTGDTFAQGKVTIPTHPMWVHFETFDIIEKPTRHCIAPPAQGVILAAGRVITGHPFWGVWLSVGLMCGALCWMLQAFLPPQWALLGGLLAILRIGSFSYWANTYFGGAAGAIGGALVLGALPRIKRSQRIRDSLLMGLGLAILANSRPYEGLVFSLPVAIALFVFLCGKQRPPLRIAMSRIVLPLALLLTVTGLAMAYYFWRITGNPLRMPYDVAQANYGVAPYLIWQPLRPEPQFHHELMRDMYVKQLPEMYRFSRSLGGPIVKAVELWSFYIGPALTLPLILLVFTLPYGFSWGHIKRGTRLMLLICGLSLIAFALESYSAPHYTAPLTGIILALIMISTRRLRLWKVQGKPSGLFLARAIPLVCVITFLLRAAAGPLHIALPASPMPAWHNSYLRDEGRVAVLKQLQGIPGYHLVIVRYKPDRIPIQEWVYNEVDIDAAKVVWAREMSPAENQELIQYFRNRRIWLVEADEKPPKLSPYQRVDTIAGASDRSEQPLGKVQ
jgi:hypothetical protein